MPHKLNDRAGGVYIISATPFFDDGAIDYDSATRLVEFYLETGVSGMTILGMMGEAPKLSDDESLAFMWHMMNAVNGRIPVVVGVSGAGLDTMNALTQASMEAGAAGVMIAPNAAHDTDEKIYGYFAAVCEKLGSEVPVCYQDFPLATKASVSPALLTRLFNDFSQIAVLKHEDWPGLSKITALRQASENGQVRRVPILVGNGGLYLPQELARGADGAMTGFAFPEMLVQVVALFKSGQEDKAQDLFDAYLPVTKHEQQPGFGLAVRKETLRRRGVIASAATRAPGPKLSAIDHTELDNLLKRLEKRLEEAGYGA